MPAVNYPSTLPAPTQWAGVPRERRAASGTLGNTQLRNRTRDALNDIDAGWAYTSAEMSIWRAWYEDTLLDGMRWFAVTVPGPGGWVQHVAKFRTKTLKHEYLGNGVFRVSAQVQQRGLSAAPDSRFCFYERFHSGLSPYSLVSGSLGYFSVVSTIYGSAVRCDQSVSTVSAIRRAIPAMAVGTVTLRFRVTSTTSYDAAVMMLRNAGASQLQLNPRTQVASDPLQRPTLSLPSAGSVVIASSALAVDTWHNLDVTLAPGTNAASIVLTRLSDNTVLQTTQTTQSPFSADSMDFHIDNDPLSSATEYADITVCSS